MGEPNGSGEEPLPLEDVVAGLWDDLRAVAAKVAHQQDTLDTLIETLPEAVTEAVKGLLSSPRLKASTARTGEILAEVRHALEHIEMSNQELTREVRSSHTADAVREMDHRLADIERILEGLAIHAQQPLLRRVLRP